MFYKATVVVRRDFNGIDPAGVTEVTIVSEIEADNYGEAADQAALTALDHRGPGVGYRITSVALQELRG